MTSPGHDMEFRPVRPEDREQIIAFCRRNWGGQDFVPRVFDRWVAERDHYFAALLLDGRTVGCGRLLPMSRRIAWLEALRIDSDFRSRGLGRRLSAHLFAEGRRRGFAELWFSTYFKNLESIRIAEDAGFRPVGAFSLLELSFERTPEAADAAMDEGAGDRPEIVDGLPDFPGYLTNDWMFIPPEVPERARFLHQPWVVRSGSCRLIMAANGKDPDATLDIAGMEGPVGEDGLRCLRHAVRTAARDARTRIQAMVPSGTPLTVFTATGFTSFERTEDILLYRAQTGELVVD